jgi:hypothetical protein
MAAAPAPRARVVVPGRDPRAPNVRGSIPLESLRVLALGGTGILLVCVRPQVSGVGNGDGKRRRVAVGAGVGQQGLIRVPRVPRVPECGTLV